MAMRKQGWLWTKESVWHKRNCFPGKWPNRFRDAWERCLHFTREKRFKMNQDAVMVPMGDRAGTRLKTLGANDVVRHDSQVGNALGVDPAPASVVTRQDLLSSTRGATAAGKVSKDGVPS